MLSLIYSFKLYICQDPRIARACTAQNIKKKCLSRLSRPASVRVRVGVRNVYSSARGVGAARRRRRLIEAILRRIAGIVCSSRRRSLRNKVAQKNRFWAYLYQVDVQTKHVQNIKYIEDTKRNNFKRRRKGIYYWYNTRSSRRTCSSCSLFDLLACHPPQLLQFSSFFSFKPCRRQAKQSQFGYLLA